jgi:predicted nucleotidyltransferase
MTRYNSTNSQKQKDKIILQLKKSLAKEKNIKLAVIFGSLTTRKSIRDIDLAVYTAPTLTFNELLNLNAQLELDLAKPVDLVELRNLSATLQTNILKNGTLIKGQKTLLRQLLNQMQTETANPRMPP